MGAGNPISGETETQVPAACQPRQPHTQELLVKGKGVWLVVQSCPTLCDPMDCSLSGSSVHGILQARTLEWVAMPSSRGSSRPRDQTRVSCITGGFFTAGPPGKPKENVGLLKEKKPKNQN